jgi:ADP-ribose pyrophosphatase YjhB (NUDIX family)
MIGQRLSAGGIVIREGKVLLVHLVEAGRFDFWVLPGGGMEGDEGILKAAEREVWEETGLTVQAERIAYVEDFIDEGKYVCKFWVYCQLDAGEISLEHRQASESCLVEAGFFKREEVLGMNVFPAILKETFWEDLEAGFPTIRYLGYRQITSKVKY